MSGGGEADETRGETGGMNTTAVQELGIGVVSACASAEDPDLALARILQEQERALWLLSYGGGGGGSLEEYEEEDGEEGAVTRNGQEREEHGMHVDQTRRRRRVRRSRRTHGVRGGNNENDGNGEGTIASDANVNDNDDDEEEQEEEHEEDVSDYNYEDDALDEDYDPENDDSDEPSVADDAALALRLQQMEDQSTMAGLVAAQLRAVSRVRGTSAGAGAMEGVFNADDDDENQHATYSLHTHTLSTLHATRYTLHATTTTTRTMANISVGPAQAQASRSWSACPSFFTLCLISCHILRSPSLA